MDGSPCEDGTVTEPEGAGTWASLHAFTVSGPHNVLVTVRDDDGGSATATVRVVVNSPPVVNAGGPYSGQEGTEMGRAACREGAEIPGVGASLKIKTASGADSGCTCSFG